MIDEVFDSHKLFHYEENTKTSFSSIGRILGMHKILVTIYDRQLPSGHCVSIIQT